MIAEDHHVRGLHDEIARAIAVEQNLINTRDRLDRELARYQAIQAYNQQAIHARDIDEFWRLTVEAIIAMFEMESSAALLRDGATGGFHAVARFGLADSDVARCSVDERWARSRSLAEGSGASVIDVRPGMQPWDSACLNQVLVCPFHRPDGGLEGFLAGCVSRSKAAYYGPIGPEVSPSFAVFTQQVSSLLHNRQHMAALERKLDELSSLHVIGTAITSMLKMDELLDMVLWIVVHDLGYDRAIILVADDQRGVLAHGRVVGGTEDCASAVSALLVPLARFDEETLFGPTRGHDAAAIDRVLTTALGAHPRFTVPLVAQGRLLGVLAVDNEASHKALTPDDHSLLSTLASQVAVAMRNARLVEEVAQSQRLAAIGETAAGIAHEIRNPLSAIGTLIDVLEAQTRGGDPFLFKGVKEECSRLQDIVSKLLDYARPCAAERTSEDINLILREVAGLLGPQAASRGVRIISDLDPGIGELSLHGDGIKQVFWNLILNGLEATPDGGAIAVRSSACGAVVEVDVTDSGPGIAREDLGRVFQPFYTTKKGGTGLGLPIAEKIVRAHGGSVALESREGRGTVARVRLPCRGVGRAPGAS